MAERVIHLFEAIEVEDHQRDPTARPLRGPNRLTGAVVEETPVGQVGQRIMQGKVFVLRRLPTQPGRGAGDNAKEDQVEQRQATEEDEGETLGITPDRGRDRAVRKVELERARRLALAVEAKGCVDLEQLPEAAIARVLRLLEVRHLRGRLAAERPAQLVRGRKSLADNRMIACVDRAPFTVPHLDARDLFPRETRLERSIEGSDASLAEPGSQFGLRELRLHERLVEQRCRLPCVQERTSTDLPAQNMREDKTEQQDRNQAR